MKLTATSTLILIILCITACHVPYAYFQSPLHGNTSSYQAIPMKSDSIKSATYVSGTFLAGGANDRLRDGSIGFVGSAYRSHQFGYFDAYYGLTTTLGNYSIAKYDTTTFRSLIQTGSYYNNNIDPKLINSLGGSKFFGAAGAIGGISAVLPMGKGEWRVIQVEGNWQREFGNYLQFRNKLPDSAANIIFRGRNYFTFSIGTDFVFKTQNGSVGFKNAVVTCMKNEKEWLTPAYFYTRTPVYFSQTFHFTNKKITGFYQMNYGFHSFGILTGVNYRLSK